MRTDLATTAILIALAVAVGILLATVPNVEGISAVCFFSGYLVGWKRGATIGATAMLLLSLLNPLGPAPPPVLASQVAGMAAVGAAGSVFRRVGGRLPRVGFWAAGFGAGLTLVYDGLTNYGVAVSIGRWRAPIPILLAGVPFAVIHIATNALIFGAVSALVTRKRWPGAHGVRQAADRTAEDRRRQAVEDSNRTTQDPQGKDRH